MSREIRITIDDDEVFERMKMRKNDLDLSWKEVLYRGLREPEDGPEPRPSGEFDEDSFFRWNPEEAVRSFKEKHGMGEPRERNPDPGSLEEVKEEFGRQLRDQIRTSLRDSFRESIESMGNRRDLEREVGELEEAEDADLRFEVLEDRPEYRVPLRVNLRTSRAGMEVEVVAVRQGKAVRETNRFDRTARRRVNEHLARGGTATLVFEEGESYAVAPVLSWGRDDGKPTVEAVEIDEVIFDDDA